MSEPVVLPGSVLPSPPLKKKKTKTFTGCATCRSRKIKCDLGRPACKRCEKSGLVCQGYQIQLCWSRPIQFDKYGYQLRTDADDDEDIQKGFQRRNIDFVRYETEYETYDEMDRDLGLLHSPDYSYIENSETWTQGPFGVFEGLTRIPTDVLRKRRKLSKKKYAKQMAESEDNSRSNSRRAPESTNGSLPLTPDAAITRPHVKQQQPALTAAAAHGLTWQHGNVFEELNVNNHEWLSNELRFDALLSATAATSHDQQNNMFSDLLYPFALSPQAAMSLPTTGDTPGQASTIAGTPTSSTPVDRDPFPYDRDVFNALRPNAAPMVRRFTEETENLNRILIETSESHMPENVIKIIETPVEPKLSPSLNIPTTGLRIGSITRFLLDHYIDKVADLMTVVVFEANPWKTIYFPRAVRALGDLAAMGRSSNSRMSLLNALLAVSCFNLQSKFQKGSTEMKFFLSLGISFRAQASSFLKRMQGSLDSPHSNEKYKDIVTAILSMNTIDVVWGTMADCQYHLALCGKIIADRIKERPKLSNKARSLHRIFSFLSLLQDSTNFQNLSHLSDEEQAKLVKLLTLSNDRLSEKGEFKENIDLDDGSVSIEYVNTMNPVAMYEPSFITSYTTKSVLHTEALYGVPNSLIMLFSEAVKLVKLRYYLKDNSTPVRENKFKVLCGIFEHKVVEWKPEWKLQDDNGKFISPLHEGLHHNCQSFYNGVIVYFFTMVGDVGDIYLQKYCHQAIEHLERLIQLNLEGVPVTPNFWQGFITGCSAINPDLQTRFREWAASLAGGGVGSYWGGRQIMLEVWRRRKHAEQNDDWLSVHKDWEMNIMLA